MTTLIEAEQASAAPLPQRIPRPTVAQLRMVEPWVRYRALRWLAEKSDDDYASPVLEGLAYLFEDTPPRRPENQDLEVVAPWIVDRLIRWGRTEKFCEDGGHDLEEVFALIFGDHLAGPKDRWYDSDGRTIEGFDATGFNAEGRDEDGYDRDGRDEDGYDRNGYDKYGFSKFNRQRGDGTWFEDWVKTEAGVEAYVDMLSPSHRAKLIEALTCQPTA